MDIVIAGGSGFIGSALTRRLLAAGHQVRVLSRSATTPVGGVEALRWDARSTGAWARQIEGCDAIINLVGQSLVTWPWTEATKRRFRDSRINAGHALSEAIAGMQARPRVLIQGSGINHYGLHGTTANESTPASDDFLAQLTVDWEASTASVEALGVRRAVVRTAVVLAADDGLLPMIARPVRLGVGGRLGNGRQAIPWIHIEDQIGAIRHLLEHDDARGAYNLIAPTPTTSDEFLRALAKTLRRPYWLPTPAFVFRTLLGEMSVLVLDGRAALPQRLIDAGYHFRFPNVVAALANLYPN